MLRPVQLAMESAREKTEQTEALKPFQAFSVCSVISVCSVFSRLLRIPEPNCTGGNVVSSQKLGAAEKCRAEK
jgi:hypothetical protein